MTRSWSFFKASASALVFLTLSATAVLLAQPPSAFAQEAADGDKGKAKDDAKAKGKGDADEAAPAKQDPAPTGDVQVEGLGAVGPCIWAQPQANESATNIGSALAMDAASQIVRAFANVIAEQAAPRTVVTQATGVWSSEDQCVFIARGETSTAYDPVGLERRLGDWRFPPRIGQDREGGTRGELLSAMGFNFSEQPDLFIEARLWRVGTTSGTANNQRIVRLEPTFIAFRRPAYTPWLRFWDQGERHFAIQVQAAAAPSTPGHEAVGGQAVIGGVTPGTRRLLVGELLHHPADGAPNGSAAFSLFRSDHYNFRISVSESGSRSTFLTFLAAVANGEHVQASGSQALQYAFDPRARDAADLSAANAATVAWVKARDELEALVRTCPRDAVDEDATGNWFGANAGQLEVKARTYAQAIADLRQSGVVRDGINDAFPTPATQATMITWCASARAHFRLPP